MWLISLPPFVILVSYGVSPSSKAFLWPLEPSQSPIPSQNHPTVFCFLSFPFLGLICNPNCSFRLVLIDCLYSVSRIWSLWEKVLTASTGSWAVPGTEEMLKKSLLNKLMAVPKHFVSQNIWLSFPSVYQLGTPRSVLYMRVCHVYVVQVPPPLSRWEEAPFCVVMRQRVISASFPEAICLDYMEILSKFVLFWFPEDFDLQHPGFQRHF